MKRFSSILAVSFAGLVVAGAVQIGGSSTTAALRAEAARDNYDTVNGVLGDESFIATFGRRPGPSDSEDLRLRTHLAYVEQLLRLRPVDHLSEDLQEARVLNLDRLHQYWTTGVFPRNTVVPDHRSPVFIDEHGRICAVGYLFERDLGREAAESINARYQTATIFEIDDPVLGEWLATSGLTQEEAAMIQPAYGPFISFIFDFTTSGATACGSNENPVPFVNESTSDVTISDMERTVGLSCADDVDDVFESSGFSAGFDPTRANRYTVTYSGMVEELLSTHMDFTVWRSANGPTEGRVVYSTDGGSSFNVMHTFGITTSPTQEFAFFAFPMLRTTT